MVKVTRKMQEAGQEAMANAPKGISMTQFAKICYKAMNSAQYIDPVDEIEQLIGTLTEKQYVSVLLSVLDHDRMSLELLEILLTRGLNNLENSLYDYSVRLSLDLSRS